MGFDATSKLNSEMEWCFNPREKAGTLSHEEIEYFND
jgi:hypothetical protein